VFVGVVATCFAASTSCHAAEVARLRVDLDGDGKLEVVTMTTAAVDTAGSRSRVALRVSAARYVAEFFSAESDLPALRVVTIDRARPQRQLLLETPEAGGCAFHLLGWVGNKFVALIRLDAEPACKSPRVLGNGIVSVEAWEGFWWKDEQYRLNARGDALERKHRVRYAMSVTGRAAKPIALGGAECPERLVPHDTVLRVTLYDAGTGRYRVETPSGDCGWLPAADVNRIDEVVRDLPWAG
jgi:hypothetical protein